MKPPTGWAATPPAATTILPTHICFDDALDFLQDVVRAEFAACGDVEHVLAVFARMRVVHGICIAPSGRPFAHAWVEQDGAYVWQGGVIDGERVFHRMPLADFMRHVPVQEATRYTVDEALRLNAESNHFGPWDERYRALALLRPPG